MSIMHVSIQAYPKESRIEKVTRLIIYGTPLAVSEHEQSRTTGSCQDESLPSIFRPLERVTSRWSGDCESYIYTYLESPGIERTSGRPLESLDLSAPTSRGIASPTI
jgi:hypothetical protein